MVLLEPGQTAEVLVAVTEALLEVLVATTFALVPEAVVKPEAAGRDEEDEDDAEEDEAEEDEEDLDEEEDEELTALLPLLTREPERTLLPEETGEPMGVLSQQVPEPTPFLPPT